MYITKETYSVFMKICKLLNIGKFTRLSTTVYKNKEVATADELGAAESLVLTKTDSGYAISVIWKKHPFNPPRFEGSNLSEERLLKVVNTQTSLWKSYCSEKGMPFVYRS